MTKGEIQRYLQALNDELERIDVKREVCLYGGTVMCLLYNARPSTKDVDAIFEPTQKMRESIARVAQKYQLAEDWLKRKGSSLFLIFCRFLDGMGGLECFTAGRTGNAGL